MKSIFDAGLITGGTESKEGRVFVTPMDPWGDDTEEAFQGDLSKPRKVHCKTKLETLSGRRLLDSFGQGTRKGIANFGRQDRMPSLFPIQSLQIASKTWYPRKM